MSQNTIKFHPSVDVFNTLSLDFIKDPYFYYQQMPDDEVLLLRSPGCWVTKDYHTIHEILSNRVFRRNFWNNKVNQFGDRIKSEVCLSTMSHWMLMNNPPDHTRLRDLIAPFFTRGRMEALRPQAEQSANTLIDRVINRGHMDIIHEYSLPLTLEFTYQIIGVPQEDSSELLSKTRPPMRLLDPPTPVTREELDLENFYMQEMIDYVTRLCALRQAEPQDDLVTHLLDIQKNTTLITQEESVSQLILLLFAGFDTVPHLIGNSLVALQQHPEQLADLKTDPSIFSTALHELLRYAPPVHMMNMEASENIRIKDHEISKNDKVICLLAAANRDPKIFQDPEKLNLRRQKKRLLSFSAGIHNCVGMHLGLMLFEIGMKVLMKRIPELQLIDLHQLDWNPSYSFRGLKSLKSQWKGLK